MHTKMDPISKYGIQKVPMNQLLVNTDKNNFYQQLFKIMPNSIKKYFDKEAKSYLYALQGQNTKMILPGDDNKNLSIHQRYLVFHVFIPIGYAWSLEIGTTDIHGIKRRINITTSQGKQQVKYFSLRYPIDYLKKGVWLFLAIDIYSFMKAFKNHVFRSLDQITLGRNCRIRRIFSMKQFVESQIPKNYWLSSEIPQQFQLIEYNEQIKLTYGDISKRITESNVSPQRIQKSVSIKKQMVQSNQLHSQINHSQNQFEKIKSVRTVGKSQMIIENAKFKLNMLQKKQEEILFKSKELDHYLKMKLNKNQKSVVKNKMKLPIIEKSFQEDEALHYQQSSNFTQQYKKQVQTPKLFESRQQIIEEDKWSDSQRLVDRQTPIQQDINTLNGYFPSTIITKQNNKQIMVKKTKTNQLQLIYDEMVGCYYHPETNTYYDLKQ